jgi:hypothetical protein
LYTEEDKNIAWYIRKHYNDLDTESGHDCLIFLIDDPHDRAYWTDPYFSEHLKSSPGIWDKNDSKVCRVALTNEGRKLIDSIKLQVGEKLLNEVLEKMDEEFLDNLLKSLDQLIKRLSNKGN